MISGYNELNVSITKTIELIGDVEHASKEQQLGIEQINDAVSLLDKKTQENASIASNTKQIAMQTQTIANQVVDNVNSKKFREK